MKALSYFKKLRTNITENKSTLLWAETELNPDTVQGFRLRKLTI